MTINTHTMQSVKRQDASTTNERTDISRTTSPYCGIYDMYKSTENGFVHITNKLVKYRSVKNTLDTLCGDFQSASYFNQQDCREADATFFTNTSIYKTTSECYILQMERKYMKLTERFHTYPIKFSSNIQIGDYLI